MVTLGFFVVLPIVWQLPICFITAELATTFQVRFRSSRESCRCVGTCVEDSIAARQSTPFRRAAQCAYGVPPPKQKKRVPDPDGFVFLYAQQTPPRSTPGSSRVASLNAGPPRQHRVGIRSVRPPVGFHRRGLVLGHIFSRQRPVPAHHRRFYRANGHAALGVRVRLYCGAYMGGISGFGGEIIRVTMILSDNVHPCQSVFEHGNPASCV